MFYILEKNKYRQYDEVEHATLEEAAEALAVKVEEAGDLDSDDQLNLCIGKLVKGTEDEYETIWPVQITVKSGGHKHGANHPSDDYYYVASYYIGQPDEVQS